MLIIIIIICKIYLSQYIEVQSDRENKKVWCSTYSTFVNFIAFIDEKGDPCPQKCNIDFKL